MGLIMKKFKDKVCPDCGVLFTPTGPSAKRCSTCARSIRRYKARVNTQAYRVRHGLVQKPGVGKGGNQLKGSDNPMYKNGSRYFQNTRELIRTERRYCERCGKDLLNVGQHYWCVHHRDHNRDNNTDDNYELLCKRCHQLEHECGKNLQ